MFLIRNFKHYNICSARRFHFKFSFSQAIERCTAFSV